MTDTVTRLKEIASEVEGWGGGNEAREIIAAADLLAEALAALAPAAKLADAYDGRWPDESAVQEWMTVGALREAAYVRKKAGAT